MNDAASQHAWDALAARLRPFIARRVSVGADIDDVLQEVLMRLHRSAGDVRDDERFKPWMYQVARSAIVDHHRSRGRSPLAGREAPDEADDDTLEGEPDMAELLALSVTPFVACLASPYREAVTLTELEGRTIREAAEMCGVSETAMKSRVRRGRQRLREMFEACCTIDLDARGHVVDFRRRPDGVIPDGCCQSPHDRRDDERS